jgi:hypothetical protein
MRGNPNNQNPNPKQFSKAKSQNQTMQSRLTAAHASVAVALRATSACRRCFWNLNIEDSLEFGIWDLELSAVSR